MPHLHRLLTLLGGAAAVPLAGLFLSSATAQAADGPYETCDGAVCLVMGPDNPDDWQYGGFRPLFTQWKTDAQPYDVQVTQADGSTVDAGSYNMNMEDTWTPVIASYTYQYGDFTPNADAPGGLDLGGFADLTGTKVYEVDLFGGAVENLNIYGADGTNYWVMKMGDFTNTVVTVLGEHGSQDYFQVGDSAPTFLYNSLDSSSFVSVPDYVVPDDPYAGPDFDPGDFAGGGSI